MTDSLQEKTFLKLPIASDSRTESERGGTRVSIYRTINGWIFARASRVIVEAPVRQSISMNPDLYSVESSRGIQSQLPAAREKDTEKVDFTAEKEHQYDSSSSKSICFTEKALPEPPYHIYTTAKKKRMVCIVSVAGILSPLSSNIYFPALGRIATVIHTSWDII